MTETDYVYKICYLERFIIKYKELLAKSQFSFLNVLINVTNKCYVTFVVKVTYIPLAFKFSYRKKFERDFNFCLFYFI